MLGPLWIPGALTWENGSLAKLEGNPPRAHGWYFLKTGIALPSSRSVALSIRPANQVRLVLDKSLHSHVTYASCADHPSWWVGGLALRSRVACAVITYRTDTGETGRRTLSIFRTCSS